MKNSEARRMLVAAGFTVVKETTHMEVYEFDEEIRVCVSKREKNDDPRTQREIESAMRRAAERRREHEARNGGALRRSAQEPKPLTAKLASVVVPRPPVAPPPAPVPPPPSPPAPPEPEEEESTEKGTRKKGELPMDKRIPLQVRVHAMSTVQKIDSDNIATILNREGLRTGSGYEWDTGRVNVFVKQHQRLLDLLGTAAPAPVVVPAGVPDYLRGLLLDQSIPGDRKVAALKALMPKLPTSVALMLEDPELEPGQKLAILAIVAQPGGAA